MAYAYKNAKGVTYYLHFKDVTLRGGEKTKNLLFCPRCP